MHKLAIFSDSIEMIETISFLVNELETPYKIRYELHNREIVQVAKEFNPDIIALKTEWYLAQKESLPFEFGAFQKKITIDTPLNKISDIIKVKNGSKDTIVVTSIENLLRSFINEYRSYIFAKDYYSTIAVRRDEANKNYLARRARLYDLTTSERKVLRELVKGNSYKLIAIHLNISIETVKTHIKKIYRKIGVNNSAAAVNLSLREGLI